MIQIFQQKNRKFITGFTLVETLVGITILSIAIIGMMSTLAGGISNINSAKQKMTATYLAQEGIEYIRNFRDTSILYSNVDWATFIANLNTFGCSGECDFTGLDFSLPPVASGYTRTLNIDSVGESEVRVVSTVTWGAGKSVTFSEYLFDWIE